MNSIQTHAGVRWTFKNRVSQVNHNEQYTAYQFFEIGLAIKVFIKKQEPAAQAVYRTTKYTATRRPRKPSGMSHQ
jgi:hypothetical protein